VDAEKPEAEKWHDSGAEANARTSEEDSVSASQPEHAPLAQAPVDAVEGGEYGAVSAQNAQSGGQEASVEQRQGTVDVRVEPWGNVFVDGELMGVTPPRVQFQADPGRIEIEIRNETHPAKHFTLDIEAGRTYRIRHVFGND
jgi:hypothetical protein